MSKIYLFVLIAFAQSDATVGVKATQTITYHATMAECQTALNQLLPQVNQSYVKLDCIPLEVK
jgi:hypothetical protein